MLCPQKAYQDYAKKHTMAAGTADSSKLELAMMRPWKRRSHLRDGNADRINSALCRSKSSSSGLSFLHHRQVLKNQRPHSNGHVGVSWGWKITR